MHSSILRRSPSTLLHSRSVSIPSRSLDRGELTPAPDAVNQPRPSFPPPKLRDSICESRCCYPWRHGIRRGESTSRRCRASCRDERRRQRRPRGQHVRLIRRQWSRPAPDHQGRSAAAAKPPKNNLHTHTLTRRLPASAHQLALVPGALPDIVGPPRPHRLRGLCVRSFPNDQQPVRAACCSRTLR